MREAVIVSAVRTPLGSLNGTLSTVKAPRPGATAIKGAVEKAGIDPMSNQEVFMGCVIQAGIGQAPAQRMHRDLRVARICGSMPSFFIFLGLCFYVFNF